MQRAGCALLLTLALTATGPVDGRAAPSSPGSMVPRDPAIVARELLQFVPPRLTASEISAIIGYEFTLEGMPLPEGASPTVRRVRNIWYRSPSEATMKADEALAAGLSDRELASLRDLVTPTSEVLARLRRFLGNPAEHHEGETKDLEGWLVEHDPERADELLARLRQIPETYVLEKRYTFYRLAAVNWSTIRRLADEWASDSSVHRRTLAQVLLYRRALHEGNEQTAALRGALMATVEDQEIAHQVRAEAMRGLLWSSSQHDPLPSPRGWQDSDRWFISRFADASIAGSLSDVVRADPYHWAPLVLPLLKDARNEVRVTAATVLIPLLEVNGHRDGSGRNRYPPVNEPLQQEIAAALIPWLGETPHQLENQSYGFALVDALARFRMTDAVPALRVILEADPLDDSLVAALAALTGVPGSGLRAEVEKRRDEVERRSFYDRLVKSWRIPADELVPAIEAFVRHEASAFRHVGLQPFEISLGSHAAQHLADRPDVALRLVDRLDFLDRDEADALLVHLANVDHKNVRDVVLDRVLRGDADAKLIAAVLRSRATYMADDPVRIRKAAARRGNPGRPVAIVMARDADAARAVLRSNDAAGDVLLAAARLTRWELPKSALRPRLTRDSGSTETIRAYLTTIDTPAARDMLAILSADRVLISGESPGGLIRGCIPQQLEAEETALRKELAAGTVREAHALFSWRYGGCSTLEPSVVLRIFPDGTGSISREALNPDAYDARAIKKLLLPATEATKLLEQLRTLSPELLPQLGVLPHGTIGPLVEFFTINRRVGRRLFFTEDPDFLYATNYDRLRRLFRDLERRVKEPDRAEKNE